MKERDLATTDRDLHRLAEELDKVRSTSTTVKVRLGLSPPARAISAALNTRRGPGYQSWLQSMRSSEVMRPV